MNFCENLNCHEFISENDSLVETEVAVLDSFFINIQICTVNHQNAIEVTVIIIIESAIVVLCYTNKFKFSLGFCIQILLLLVTDPFKIIYRIFRCVLNKTRRYFYVFDMVFDFYFVE